MKFISHLYPSENILPIYFVLRFWKLFYSWLLMVAKNSEMLLILAMFLFAIHFIDETLRR